MHTTHTTHTQGAADIIATGASAAAGVLVCWTATAYRACGRMCSPAPHTHARTHALPIRRARLIDLSIVAAKSVSIGASRLPACTHLLGRYIGWPPARRRKLTFREATAAAAGAAARQYIIIIAPRRAALGYVAGRRCPANRSNGAIRIGRARATLWVVRGDGPETCPSGSRTGAPARA